MSYCSLDWIISHSINNHDWAFFSFTHFKSDHFLRLFEESVFIFQFLNDKIYNYVLFDIIVNFIIQKLKYVHVTKWDGFKIQNSYFMIMLIAPIPVGSSVNVSVSSLVGGWCVILSWRCQHTVLPHQHVRDKTGCIRL